jgi:hypothetical protein
VGDRNAHMIGKFDNQHVVLVYMSGMGNISARSLLPNLSCQQYWEYSISQATTSFCTVALDDEGFEAILN